MEETAAEEEEDLPERHYSDLIPLPLLLLHQHHLHHDHQRGNVDGDDDNDYFDFNSCEDDNPPPL